MAETDLFYRCAVALFIGLLIGLEREHSHGSDLEIVAGVRTFPLFALTGCVAALAAQMLSSVWVFVSILVILSAWIAIGYFANVRRGNIGLTTEASVLLTFLTGALCYWDHLTLAVALGVVTTLLLSLKLEMQKFVRRITQEDIYATLKFAVITAIILPVLPKTSFGPPPLDVLVPYDIWLMVVLISGMSFLGYVLIKLVDPNRGIGLVGFLGGMISSTAVTLSFVQRSKEHPELAGQFALAILVAWVVMFLRILVIIAAINGALLGFLWIPMIAAAIAGLGYCLYLYSSHKQFKEEQVAFSNPFGLGPALKFGLVFCFILLVSKAAQVYLGATGVYLSSILAGAADVDAITLSMAKLSGGQASLALQTASKAVVLAAVANTIVKGGIAVVSGSSSLRKEILPGFILILLVLLGMVLAF